MRANPGAEFCRGNMRVKFVYGLVRSSEILRETLSSDINRLGFPPVFQFNQISFFYQGYSYLSLIGCKEQ
jgi:hypothetical protein